MNDQHKGKQTLEQIVNEFIEKVADFKRAHGDAQAPYETRIFRPLDSTNSLPSHFTAKLEVEIKIR